MDPKQYCFLFIFVGQSFAAWAWGWARQVQASVKAAPLELIVRLRYPALAIFPLSKAPVPPPQSRDVFLPVLLSTFASSNTQTKLLIFGICSKVMTQRRYSRFKYSILLNDPCVFKCETVSVIFSEQRTPKRIPCQQHYNTSNRLLACAWS